MTFQEKVEKLPKDIKEFFLSNKPLLESMKSFVVLGINPELNKKISKEIGLVFVGDIALESLPSLIIQKTGLNSQKAYGVAWELNKRMFSKFSHQFHQANALLNDWQNRKVATVFTEDVALRKLIEIMPWVKEILKQELAVKKEKQRQLKTKKQTISVTFAQAIKKFPELQGQIITQSRVPSDTSSADLPPTIRNWVNNYFSVVGTDNKDSMKRSNYIYHSNNTKMLRSKEKRRLAEIFRSIEENTKLEIDGGERRIVFRTSEQAAPPPTKTSGQSIRPIEKQKLSFISGGQQQLRQNNNQVGGQNFAINKNNSAEVNHLETIQKLEMEPKKMSFIDNLKRKMKLKTREEKNAKIKNGWNNKIEDNQLQNNQDQIQDNSAWNLRNQQAQIMRQNNNIHSGNKQMGKVSFSSQHTLPEE